MRIFPRISWPRFKFRRQRFLRRLRRISISHLSLLLAAIIYGMLLLFVFTGGRNRLLTSIGQHADVYVSLLLLAVLALALRYARRRLIPRIEQHFFPKPYEERRILSSFGQEARTAASIDQLYEAIVSRIAHSFEADNAALLVRDERSGDYKCVALSSALPASPHKPKKEPTSQTNNELKLTREAFVVKRLNGLATPLVIEAAEIETWGRAFSGAPTHLREARSLEQTTLRLLKSHLLVQIRTKDQMVGILSLGLRRSQFSYGIADRETLMTLAGQLALVIENSRLAQRMLIQERLNRELLLATKVQQRLLPATAPKCLTLELAGFCEPARGVGGDYYDFIRIDQDRVGIAIADVAGKGMPAALLMSTVQATLRSLSTMMNGNGSSGSLAQMVAKLNRLVFESTNGEHYVTFFFAHFDDSTRDLTYVNAGHNPPLYLKSNGRKEFHRLSCGGLIAGAFEQCKYEQETLQLQPNDLLFLYTDGLTEAVNREGDEFGELRMQNMLADYANLPVHEIRDHIVRRIKEWCKGLPLYDDLTFVVMKVK